MPRAPRSFTLLEALVATFILSAVAIVCLQLRAGSLRDAVAIREAQHRRSASETILRLAEENMLPNRRGPEEDDPSRRVVWQGEHLGEAYRCERRVVLRMSPLTEPAARGLSERVVLHQYELTYAGRTRTTLRPVMDR